MNKPKLIHGRFEELRADDITTEMFDLCIADPPDTRYTSSVRPVYWLKDPYISPTKARIPSARQEKYGDKRANPEGKMPDNLWIYSRVCGTFKERRKWHPCQLPEALVRRILKNHSSKGARVLDPFI